MGCFKHTASGLLALWTLPSKYNYFGQGLNKFSASFASLGKKKRSSKPSCPIDVLLHALLLPRGPMSLSSHHGVFCHFHIFICHKGTPSGGKLIHCAFVRTCNRQFCNILDVDIHKFPAVYWRSSKSNRFAHCLTISCFQNAALFI